MKPTALQLYAEKWAVGPDGTRYRVGTKKLNPALTVDLRDGRLTAASPPVLGTDEKPGDLRSRLDLDTLPPSWLMPWVTFEYVLTDNRGEPWPPATPPPPTFSPQRMAAEAAFRSLPD